MIFLIKMIQRISVCTNADKFNNYKINYLTDFVQTLVRPIIIFITYRRIANISMFLHQLQCNKYLGKFTRVYPTLIHLLKSPVCTVSTYDFLKFVINRIVLPSFINAGKAQKRLYAANFL